VGKAKRTAILIILLVLPLLLSLWGHPFSLHIKTGLSDFLYLPLKAVSETLNKLKGLLFYKDMIRENSLLKNKIALLERRILDLEEETREIQRLRDLLSFKKELQFPTLAAKVIGRQHQSWLKSVIIDRGSANGITVGLPVVVPSGLVGKIKETGRTTSKVLLITDPNFKVAAIVQSSRDQGLLEGDFTGRCKLKYLTDPGGIKEGDLVITSGLDGTYPKGISLGEIIRIHKELGGLFWYAEVKPKADIAKLEEVLVIMQLKDESR
jgi:rod shape-determining protein MreC